MKFDAIVMAGGKGSRMRSHVEKPLIKLKGKSMIEYVIEALKVSEKIGEIYVSVTKSTQGTMKFLSSLGIQTVITPGFDYIADMRYFFKTLDLEKALVVVSDLPLLSSKIIDEIIYYYEMNYSPSLTVVVPSWKYDRLGLSLRSGFKHKGLKVYPIGINIIDGKYIDYDEIEQKVLILDQVKPLVNVNTVQDLKVAEALLK